MGAFANSQKDLSTVRNVLNSMVSNSVILIKDTSSKWLE